MSVHTFRLDENLENELNNLIKETGKTKTHFLKEALKSYLEDRADYIKGISVLEKIKTGELETIGYEEFIQGLDL